ncbi:alpha-amylase family glycosyl hydrolase [Thermodesulfovibrio thiophilus]|uniref:alpha-amylase family glycosyl hydrolase n=1 Tax=Thermodesulfovibrio thiophilus TaxID=340095 RepID=UPI000410DE7B|nr:alpha-amylase family glycosyl hydrolase [Thermodesulfovibrio thiophilus]
MRIPCSTYRLQFNHRFTFSEAKKVIKYLYELGITEIYASPYLKASKGSLHGYDIVDYNSLNHESRVKKFLLTKWCFKTCKRIDRKQRRWENKNVCDL